MGKVIEGVEQDVYAWYAQSAFRGKAGGIING
jgi:hypothetical protein